MDIANVRLPQIQTENHCKAAVALQLLKGISRPKADAWLQDRLRSQYEKWKAVPGRTTNRIGAAHLISCSPPDISPRIWNGTRQSLPSIVGALQAGPSVLSRPNRFSHLERELLFLGIHGLSNLTRERLARPQIPVCWRPQIPVCWCQSETLERQWHARKSH
jgi:hypothetical protein